MSQDESAISDVARVPLKTLKLRPGMALQTRRLVEGANKRESQFFGAIEGKGVMVGPLGPDGEKTELVEGEVCVVRGFTGQYEFSFLSKVLQTFEKPFAYALLVYPAQVDARLVRQSMRTKTSWPCSVQLPQTNGSVSAATPAVTLVDISLHGAMIAAPNGLAAVGDSIELCMAVTFDEMPVLLKLSARICHNNPSSDAASYFIGLAFKNLTQHDKLVLHYVTQASQT